MFTTDIGLINNYLIKINYTAATDNKSKTLQHSFHTFVFPYLFIHSSEN